MLSKRGRERGRSEGRGRRGGVEELEDVGYGGRV